VDQANINERVLFPGLDGLSRWLTRYYTPAEKLVKQSAASSVTDRRLMLAATGPRRSRRGRAVRGGRS
jgi:hypothetical protein